MTPVSMTESASRKESVMRKSLVLAFAVAVGALCGAQNANAQGVFTLSSTSFKDGERLATKMAGNNKSNPNCVGENVSPALSWSNPPEGTKSFAILMLDIDGRPPGGVSHWVAYGIPASVTGFAEGEVSKQTDKFVGGQSLMKLPHYFGPCTPPGPPHHYIFTLMATDLEPSALKEGMTRDEVIKALDGHAKGATSLVGIFSKQ
jgi:Raf kinase inhibitor-like YbhB/YbcL family protein